MKLVQIELLKHIEGFSQKRAEMITKKILKDKIWNKAICIEKNYNLVLDGQHRLEAAKKLGLKLIPCELFDYEDVEVWSLRKTHAVTRELVIERAIAGDIYPYKTAKHKFPITIEECRVNLEDLI